MSIGASLVPIFEQILDDSLGTTNIQTENLSPGRMFSIKSKKIAIIDENIGKKKTTDETLALGI